MKRHPSLAQLSREHHPALVLARALDPRSPASLTASLPGRADERLARLRRVWQQELSPHFMSEERALVPLSFCASQELRAHAGTIVQQHTALRLLFESLTPDNLVTHAPQIATALEEHVRFEERVWFVALQATLSERDLAQAERQMRSQPVAAIVGFQQDEDGVWVAELECGHRQHVRHKPPFHNAPWVMQEDGRASKLGSELPCPLCRMPRLPTCARPYKETSTFDEASVPAGLCKRHELKSETWARIVVEAGRVQYVLEDEGNFTLTLKPGTDGIVAPCRPHHVELQPGARFRVVFLRLP